METFPSRRRWFAAAGWVFAALIGVPAGHAEDADSAARQVAMSPCFVRSYGGFFLYGPTSDGRLRLTAEARSRNGESWGLELMIAPDEAENLWEGAVKSSLSPDELSGLKAFCQPSNVDLFNARRKDALNKGIVQLRMAGVAPVGLTAADQALTESERIALTAFNESTQAQAAMGKLRAVAGPLVVERFLELASGRTKHLRFDPRDQKTEAERRAYETPASQRTFPAPPPR
jgi:hypothetical protein